MLQGWVVIAVALAYIGLLFLVASYGDRTRGLLQDGRTRLLIYPLSLAIYCTSWTFFGSVGSASRTGYEFLTIYIGPMLMIGLFSPLLVRIVRLAKAQNITSIADFIAARYGKGQAVAATVALIAIVGTVPYIALQLKAVSSSLETIIAHISPGSSMTHPLLGDIALFVALSMATFAVLFGTRHIDATEHQDGLMLAIATESLVKLFAFLAVGIFVTFWMFGGPGALLDAALHNSLTTEIFTRDPPIDTLVATTLLSFVAIILLPRQFHVAVVENHNEREIKRAAWLFPLYLVLINLFVVPIALAGLLTFPTGTVDSDMFVLALPLQAGSNILTIAAFVGGLSAATAMVIVESVALSIMVSNDIVMPLVLQRREALISGRENIGSLLLTVRRLAIFAILLLAYMYYRAAGEAQLFAIGILSFAAIAQLAPAFFGGLLWRRATAAGAIAGMTAGILVWAYTLLLPSFADIGFIGQRIITDGPWGLAMLRPQHLLGLELPPLVHGVVWSLMLNIACYIGVSLRRAPTPIERLQANLFVPSELAPIAPSFRLWRSSVTVEELSQTVARYLGEERTRSAFESFAASQRVSIDPMEEADFRLVRYRRAYSRLGDRGCLLAAGALALAAQAHGLDQGRLEAARRRQCRHPVQPRNPADRARSRAPGHRGVRQGPRTDLLEPAIRRNPRPAAEPDPRRHRARRNPALQRATQRNQPRPHRRIRAQAAGALHFRQRAVPGTLRRARHGDRGARQPHAGWRHRHHLHRHHRQRGGGRGARARQREPGAARARAHRGAHAAQWGARARQGRGRCRQYFQDQVPGGGQPRHSAAAQRRAPLRHQPDRAPARP